MDYLLGIDLGTSSCKTVLFTAELEAVCSASAEYPTLYPKKGWAEQQADLWWKAVVRTIRDILQKVSINPKEITGIGVDSQGSALLPVDGTGKPLRNALLWMDRRSQNQCQINNDLKKLLWEINGNYNDPSNIAPKILWIKENEPEIYQRTHKFLHANGYLVFKLTGRFSMDISEGGLTQLFNTKKGCWSHDLIEGYGIDGAKLPDIYNCYEFVGVITKEAAATTGLAEGIPVVAGAMDMVASALGSGVYKRGQVYVAGGTVTAVGICTDKPEFLRALHIYHYIIPGMWIKAAGVDFGGGGLRWFKELLEDQNYDELNNLASKSPPGSNGLVFLPYMVGQRAPLWNNNTRGVIFGLSPDTNKQDLVRMFMEGNAFGVKYILEIAREAGVSVDAIKMTGGCSKSAIWAQIFADITGLKIQIPGRVDVAALGSAITAGYGVGIFSDFPEVMNRINIEREYNVNKDYQELYEKMYRIYRNLYSNLKNEFDLLADMETYY